MDEYWNAADDMTLAKVNQGLAQVQSDLDMGQLDQTDAGPMLQELAGKRQALDSRRQAAQVAQKGRERVQLQDDLAFQQSTMLRNQQHSANEFMTTTAAFKDPETQKVSYFYQKRPGEFEPMD